MVVFCPPAAGAAAVVGAVAGALAPPAAGLGASVGLAAGAAVGGADDEHALRIAAMGRCATARAPAPLRMLRLDQVIAMFPPLPNETAVGLRRDEHRDERRERHRVETEVQPDRVYVVAEDAGLAVQSAPQELADPHQVLDDVVALR